MAENTETELDKVFSESELRGICDICGCYSTMLLDGICQKAVCQRYLEENKHYPVGRRLDT